MIGIVNKSDIEKQRDQKVSTNLNRAYSQLKRQNRGWENSGNRLGN